MFGSETMKIKSSEVQELYMGLSDDSGHFEGKKDLRYVKKID